MSKRILVVIGIVLALSVVMGGIALAQGTNPDTPQGVDRVLPALSLGLPRGGWAVYDAVADALHLTPTALFEMVHDGKTLQEIADAQGVDIATVREAAKTQAEQAAKDRIQQGLEDGTITQDHADWLTEGLENGWGAGRGIAPRLRARIQR